MALRTGIVVLLVLLAGCLGSASFYGDDPATDGPQFEEVSGEVGLNYTATNTHRPTYGGGAYVTDFDNDGWPDLLLLGGVDRRAPTGEFVTQRPVLMENDGGEFAANESALPSEELKGVDVLGAVFFDADGDGWEDLLLLPESAEPIFFENEAGRFVRTDQGFDVELDEPAGATVADYDGDGRLDVFVYQNGDWDNRTPEGYSKPNETVEDDNGNSNVLFRNTGDGFEPVTNAGISGKRWSLAASFADLTGNGHPDIHVANDYNNDYLYLNRGDGTFEEVRMGGVTDRNGMSSAIGDLSGNERPDVFVTNIYFDRSNLSSPGESYIEHILGKRMAGNTLLVNEGNGTFVDRADEFGVRKGGWGWAAVITDFDNDGAVELLHTTRHFRDIFEDDSVPVYAEYPMLFERSDEGFRAVSPGDTGFEVTNGLGVVTLDYDRDGARDVVITQQDGTVQLYENRAGGGNWIQLRLLNDERTTAYGAEVFVTAGDDTQYRIQTDGSDFASQDSRVLHVGVGSAETIDEIRVEWPDGTTDAFTDVDPNQRLVVTPGDLDEANETDGRVETMRAFPR